jgi:hypothetical protein
MPTTKNSEFSTPFQQIFAVFYVFMAKICISLSFFVLASKLRQLLITTNTSISRKSNRIQREFDSNGAIPPFDHKPSAPKNKPFQTVLLPLLAKRGGVLSLCAAERGVLSLCAAEKRAGVRGLFSTMESQSSQPPPHPHPPLLVFLPFASHKQSPSLDSCHSPNCRKEWMPQHS